MQTFDSKSVNAYRRVFVLGSGFSKSFLPCMPTLNDLNALIPEGIPDEFPHFKAYCEQFLELCNGDKDYLKIERLATSILSARIFPGERERLYHASLRFEMLRFIARTIWSESMVSGEAAVILRKFLESSANEEQHGENGTLFLSFNYDTLIERAIAADPELSKLMSVDYCVRIDPADRSAHRVKRNKTIDLIKLHGSLNWFTVKGCSEELDLNNVCQVEPEDRSFPIYSEDTPIYIPMAHAKESFLRGSLFNVLWSKADFYLRNAEEIYFLGYGFPKTDLNNLEFLLRHREKFRKVVVLGKVSEELERLRRLFGEDVVAACDVKEFLKSANFCGGCL